MAYGSFLKNACCARTRAFLVLLKSLATTVLDLPFWTWSRTLWAMVFAISSLEPILEASCIMESSISIPRFWASWVTLFDFPTELMCCIIFWVSINDYKFIFAFSSFISFELT